MKFRIWDEESKIFVDLTKYYINYLGDIFYFEDMDNEFLKCKNCIIQYSSGKKDLHGKDIYEGDIVKYTSWNCEWEDMQNKREYIDAVELTNGKFYPIPFTENCDDGFYSYGVKNLEIIGNIFENRYLLCGRL